MQNQVLYKNQMDAQPNTSANVIHKGRRIRTSFTSFQLNRLEEVFKQRHLITRTARYNLSLELNLHEKQIKIWFQNRRMKEKKENSVAANNAGTPALQTPANRNNSTMENRRGYNTLINPQVLPPYQIDTAQKFSPLTSYYANSAALLDQAGYQNNLLLQVSSSSSSYNTNSPPMNQNLGNQNALQMPSTTTYNSNPSPILSQNLGFHKILQLHSNNSNSSPLMDPTILYQNNDLPSNLSPAAVKPISPSSYQSNYPTIDPTSYRFDGIQGDIVAPQFITPSFKNEDCIEQYPSLNETNNYLSPVTNTTNEEQSFLGDINYYEIQQILGNSY